MVRALLFGAGSFLADHLQAELREAQVESVATSRRTSPNSGLLACDICSQTAVEAVVRNVQPEFVINCAGATNTLDESVLYRTHVAGTLNILSATRRFSPSSKFVFFGSAAEYGCVDPSRLPISEDQQEVPGTAFGISKLAQTYLARGMADRWGLHGVILRPFNLLGAGLPRNYVAAAIGLRLLQAMEVEHSGTLRIENGQATRDFVDVRDVVRAVIGLMQADSVWGNDVRTFNIASGRETSILCVAEHLCRVSGGAYRAVDAGTRASRSGIMRSAGDSAAISAAIGWKPQFTLERSIKDLWDAMKSGIESPDVASTGMSPREGCLRGVEGYPI